MSITQLKTMFLSKLAVQSSTSKMLNVDMARALYKSIKATHKYSASENSGRFYLESNKYIATFSPKDNEVHVRIANK